MSSMVIMLPVTKPISCSTTNNNNNNFYTAPRYSKRKQHHRVKNCEVSEVSAIASFGSCRSQPFQSCRHATIQETGEKESKGTDHR